ncbi:hypothetical protein M0R45_019632 [Rubus argutus]|uniref:MHC class I antigen n=1 Tax=Rubus argutus TaxID=59490 RepID=A0AAW1X5Y4_RUBAR
MDRRRGYMDEARLRRLGAGSCEWRRRRAWANGDIDGQQRRPGFFTAMAARSVDVGLKIRLTAALDFWAEVDVCDWTSEDDQRRSRHGHGKPDVVDQ